MEIPKCIWPLPKIVLIYNIRLKPTKEAVNKNLPVLINLLKMEDQAFNQLIELLATALDNLAISKESRAN